MAWITDRNRSRSGDIAGQVNGAVKHLARTLQPIRDRAVQVLPLGSRDVREAFQLLASTRRYIKGVIATQGLTEAYRRDFPEFGDFDPVAEWPALEAAIDDLLQWLKNVLPKHGNGAFAFERPNADTGELEPYDITLTAGQANAVVQRFDRLLNAID